MLGILNQILDQFSKPQSREPNDLVFVYSHKYNLELMGHVFPAIKYEQLYNLISMDEELGRRPIFHPEPIERKTLENVHTEKFLDDFFSLKMTELTRHSELPLNHTVLETFLYGVGGTVLATELSEKHNFVFNIGGGYHHSYADHAEGFCYLNDVAVAAHGYLRKFPENKILIIDLDVHQGNGNSSIFRKEERVFTFSMHQENLYPVKEKSDLDIGLPDGCGNGEYLSALDESLTRIAGMHRPDLIYYLAGADPFEDDRLGGLKLTKEGLISRDKRVKDFAIANGSKVVVLTAGGYANNTIDTVQIHFNTAREFYYK